jgi:DNA-directed RNA polymerase subunit L
MSKNIDVKVKDKVNKSDLFGSKLVIEFNGKNNNHTIVNAIRRVAMDSIPTYAFWKDLMVIEANTSIFNNDYMKLRLSQLPIFDIKSDIEFLHPRFWDKVDYKDTKREKHLKEKNIEFYLNVHNNTPENINVTTNDARVVIDSEITQMYNKKYPILITQLRPNESFKCYLRATLGVGEKNNIWSAVNTSFYDIDEKEESKITLTLESQGQLTEKDILVKSAGNIIYKLDEFKNIINKKIKDKEITDENLIRFEFKNEDHTFGELLNRAFQDHPKITFSGVSKPDHLIKMIRFTVQAETSPVKYMLEQIDYLHNLFTDLKMKFDKIN